MQDTSCEHLIPSKSKSSFFIDVFQSLSINTDSHTKVYSFFLTEVFSFSFQDFIPWWCAHALAALSLAISTCQTLVVHPCGLVFNSKSYPISCYQSFWVFNHDPYHSLSIFNIFLDSVQPNSFFMDFSWKKCN